MNPSADDDESAGYVGGPTSAIIAYKNPSISVTVVDVDAERIDAWNSSSLPIYEPGLADIVSITRDGISQLNKENHGRHAYSDDTTNESKDSRTISGRRANLFFSTNVDKAVAEADIIFVTVNTPVKSHGIGSGEALDMTFVEAATKSIALAAKGDKIVVEKSTVPCRTAEWMRDILEANASSGVRFTVLSNPEFLAEGSAVMDLLCPDRVLIGSLPDLESSEAAASLAEIYAAWVPADRIITMNLWSAELSKLAANALLAQRISSINSISAICEATGADVDEVAYACGLDTRIGPRMLKAGPGFGGSCLKKDILNLAYLAESLHLPQVATYWRSVVEMNEFQIDRFAQRIITCLSNTVRKKKIAILGFTYKEDTGDVRESAAIKLATTLIAEEAQLLVFDPVAQDDQIWKQFAESGFGGDRLGKHLTICRTAYDACVGAHAVVIPTAWDYFSNKISLAQSTPVSTPIPGELDPDRVAVAQLTSSASSLSIKSLNDKMRVAIFAGPSSAIVAADAERLVSGTLTGHENNPQVAQREGEERQHLDWASIAEVMQDPMLVFDSRNILDVDKLEKLGFQVESIGKPSLTARGYQASNVFSGLSRVRATPPKSDRLGL
ncbi:MAG: hypothetical protein M1825_004842 [Sarcosagium campestre]|nr:MAG: hypothetical protein M1825_004842 [Sarcosagium campestre]